MNEKNKEIKEIKEIEFSPELNNKQVDFLLTLVHQANYSDAIRVSDIDRKTLYNWMLQEPFQNAVYEIRKKLLNESISSLSFLLTDCIEAYKDSLEQRDSLTTPELNALSIRLKSANSILDRISRLKKVSEYEERFEAIEKALNLRK